MSLTPSVIEAACNRFEREQDRFIKMTRTVEAHCLQYFLEDSAVQANITARTKSLYSFRKKLYRLMNKGQKTSWSSENDVFENLTDFSGVRIALYSGEDLQSVAAGLKRIFQIIDVQDHDKKRDLNDPCKYYKAIHYQVVLKESDLASSPKLRNLDGLSCEIQVCTMMNHVWNEIEHDIGYKPSGEMGTEEREAMSQFGELTREGDKIINELLSHHRKRCAKQDRLDDPAALTDVLADIFSLKRITFRENTGSLFETLHLLGIKKISKLQKAFDAAANQGGLGDMRALWRKAQGDINRFNTFLRKHDHEQYCLDSRNSADPALFILLSALYPKILNKLPAGRGQGRPYKIRSLASRYKEYIERQ